jgi:hypothetical protein
VDIQIIQIDPKTNVVRFEISNKIVTGVTKLAQLFLIDLLDSPGFDVLFPEDGGGIPTLIGSNIDINDSREIFAEITRRIRKTENEIKQQQIGLNAPDDERLRDARIISIRQQPGDPLSIAVAIRITNEAGRQLDLVL